MPFIAQTAIGKRKFLNVFGDDYNTPDGNEVRDYIHVVDLALGHVKALQKIDNINEVLSVNLGTGHGYSVLDLVKAFQEASGQKVPYKITQRRPGDVAKCFADPSYAKKVLNWEVSNEMQEICEDSWRWQSANPNGYK